MRNVIIFGPTSLGGLAEHIHYQANALVSAGLNVTVIGSKSFLERRNIGYHFVSIIPEYPKSSGIIGKFTKSLHLVNRYRLLENYVSNVKCDLLFIESYSEYLAPFWAYRIRRLARTGIIIGANLHDPVRDYKVGPTWWHDLSVREAYSFLNFGLAHQKIPQNASVPPNVTVHVVPVGVYEDSQMIKSLDQLSARQQLDIPKDKKVFLAFGFLRDNKNLNLFIQAMNEIEDVYLVVAGRSQSSKDKPVSYYKQLAEQSGVSDRVGFHTGFISDEKIPLYFEACEFVLMTYSESFHSQSGVLNIAANYRKPVFASSGDSPLKECVERFRLGVFVEPDDKEAIKRGLERNFSDSECNWNGYFEYASWKTNVAPIVEMLNAVE